MSAYARCGGDHSGGSHESESRGSVASQSAPSWPGAGRGNPRRCRPCRSRPAAGDQHQWPEHTLIIADATKRAGRYVMRAPSREHAAATGPTCGISWVRAMTQHLGAFRARADGQCHHLRQRGLGGGPGISQDEQLSEFWQEFCVLIVVMACLPHAGDSGGPCCGGGARCLLQRLRELCGAFRDRREISE